MRTWVVESIMEAERTGRPSGRTGRPVHRAPTRLATCAAARATGLTRRRPPTRPGHPPAGLPAHPAPTGRQSLRSRSSSAVRGQVRHALPGWIA